MASTAADTAAMDIGDSSASGEDLQPTNVLLNHDIGRTAVAVSGTELLPTDTEGWQAAGKRLRQRVPTTASGEPTGSQVNPTTSRAAYAKRVAARISRAARMPRALPREESKIVLRPRGGLNVARTEASRIMTAVFAAAGTTLQESKDDTICANAAQNIIVVSTPSETRANKYASIRRLCVGEREHEVCAYLSAPNGTAKGVIRGIALTDTYQDLQKNIVNEANPLALDAHRIGNTTTVIVVFEGTKLPNFVKY